MGQILSHSEIVAILSGLKLSTGASSSSSSAVPNKPADDITPYDFEHPIPLHPAQLDSLRLACATVTQAVQSGLVGLFRQSVAVEFLGVEQSTFRDFLATSEKPGCLAIFESTNPPGNWFLDISRSLAFTMIDCLLGGSPMTAPPATTVSRPFTELEARFIDKAVRTVLPELTGSVFHQISLRLSRVVSDGGILAEAQSNEAVALISYEIVCGESRGLMQFCVPWTHVAHDSQNPVLESGQLREVIRSGACKIPVTATARVTRIRLSARELANLSPGDVLLTDSSVDAEMSLEVGGREIFRGTPGQIQDRRVLRLTLPVTQNSAERPTDGDR